MRPRFRAASLAIVTIGALGACPEPPTREPSAGSSTGGPEGTDSTGTSGSSGIADTTAAPEGPPVVIDIGQDVLVLTEGESMVLTVVVADPNDDVVSGELLGPGVPELYDTFTPHPSDRWRATIGWAQLFERWPQSFRQEIDVPLRVRFVDAQGHEVTAFTSIRAICAGLSNTACHGACVNIQVDDAHCNGCDQGCRIGPALAGYPPTGGCQSSACQPWWGACVRVDPRTGPRTCAESCAAQGARCAQGGCGPAFEPDMVMPYGEEGICARDVAVFPVTYPCDADLSGLGAAAVFRCCCE